MLMRHMHMGIIMDIMIACCFIMRFSLPHFITLQVLQKGYHTIWRLVNPF